MALAVTEIDVAGHVMQIVSVCRVWGGVGCVCVCVWVGGWVGGGGGRGATLFKIHQPAAAPHVPRRRG